MFTFTVVYEGAPNPSLDSRIMTAAGKEYWLGGGYGFGERDMQFMYPTLEVAEHGYQKILTIPYLKVFGIEVMEDGT